MAETMDLSVVVPVYNEVDTLGPCIRSLQEQAYPDGAFEIIVVDGGSTDGTAEVLAALASEYPANLRVLDNPRRTQAVAMNMGLRAAHGRYLMRADAHALYPPTYCATLTRLLESTGAQNVGGLFRTEALTSRGALIALVLTSPFAVGGSAFRVGSESGPADTVPFGTFRTAYLREVGGYDERLARNEDNELNYRIRKRGGLVYLTNEVAVTYYCRETPAELVRMAFGNGRWCVLAARVCPGCMSAKYFVPFLFVCSLIVLPPLAAVWPLLAVLLVLELCAYGVLAFAAALQKTHRPGEVVRMLGLFLAFHVAYGLGSLAGVVGVVRGWGPDVRVHGSEQGGLVDEGDDI